MDEGAAQPGDVIGGRVAPLSAQACAAVLEVVRRARGFDPAGYCPVVLAARV